MKSLLLELKTSLLMTLVFVLLLCGVYPAVVWAGGQLLFREQANGSLLVDPDGSIRGSALLAQSFTSDRYFHPRSSAAGAGYDAANSSGSNLGPTSQKLAEAIQSDVAAYRTENKLASDAPVPADAVTRSGSGLDPHISVANAELQAARIAQARGLPLATVLALVHRQLEPREFGMLGEPRVNVLLLNRALDEAERNESEKTSASR
jgi:K+-transporting ATPase ATPase C chain